MGFAKDFTRDIAGDGAKLTTYILIGAVAVLAVIMALEYAQAEAEGTAGDVGAKIQNWWNTCVFS